MATGYYRFPTIAGDRVVFVSEDELFEVDRRGGPAHRLTTGFGRVTHPVLSSDGRWLAFVGHEEGDQEVYIMPGAGGAVRRLTYVGGGATPVAVTDQHVIFVSRHGQAFASQNRLYRVPVTGGEPELLPYGHANAAAFSPDGGVILNWWARDPADWKRYRGGRRGVLWIDAHGTGEFARYAPEDGNLASPMWIGGQIFFLSDHEGIGNLYSMDPSATDLKRHTNQRRYYARNASTDGQRVVYHAGGDLYVYDPRTGEEQRLAIDLVSQLRLRQPKHIDAAEYLTEYRLDHDGSALTLVTRGKPYRLGPFEGPVLPLGVPQGVRYRLLRSVSLDTWLVVSDEGGEDGLEIRRLEADGSMGVRRLAGDFGLVQQMEVSPDGGWAALSNQRLEVWVIDLHKGTAAKIAQSEHGAAQGLAWSPDSRWLAYSLPVARLQSALYLYSLESRTSTAITEPVLSDRSPVFDPAGRYLYFLSKRTFKPVHDAVRFDRSFLRADKVYAIALAKDTRSPFYAVGRPAVGGGEETPVLTGPMTVDLENIQKRVVEFPMKAADIAQLQAAPGRVFWTTRDPEDPPALYEGPKGSLTLHQYRFDELKEESLASHVTSFQLSSDGRVMAVLSGRTLRVLKAGDKWEKKLDEKPGRDSGLMDLSRVAVMVEPEAEWQQMLRDAWRLMRALFWTPNMSGVDWNAVYDKYSVLVPRLTCRSDLSDLLWEMHGELGTSHAYEMNGDYTSNPRHRMGYLGADYRWNGNAGGYEITSLVEGDVWAQDQHSPLLDPGVNAVVGDVITAIDGEALSESLPPGARLVNKGQKDVQLTLKSASGGHSRTVVVRTLADETPARYRTWVESNRRLVHERTGGKVGYLHIPDMQDPGFAEFHRGFLQELGRQGLIVDVRFNRGGSVSSLLLEELSRRRLGYMVPRYGKPGTYFREGGPLRMVALTNEFAGSDGDIVSHTWKMLGLGPLIGTRTWGGVVGINPQYRLVDGTTTTQPFIALWFYDVEWGVENYGTDPTIEVFNRPQDQARGYDAQMERGLEEIQRILEEDPPIEPAFDKRPNLAVNLED